MNLMNLLNRRELHDQMVYRCLTADCLNVRSGIQGTNLCYRCYMEGLAKQQEQDIAKTARDRAEKATDTAWELNK